MNFESFFNSGWRLGLAAVIVALLLYVIVVFWRMYRLRHKQLEAADAPMAFMTNTALASYQSMAAPLPPEVDPAPALGTPEFQFPWNEPPEPHPEQDRIEDLERKFVRLSKELGALRDECAQLRTLLQKHEETRQHEETRLVSPAKGIAPQYSDAMQMALRDYDAGTISQQCDISRAEAELVLALARNRDSHKKSF